MVSQSEHSVLLERPQRDSLGDGRRVLGGWDWGEGLEAWL